MVITLTTGEETLLDAADWERFSGFVWRLNDGYAVRSVGGRERRLHREIVNAAPRTQVHHRNEQRLDNRRENLKVAYPSDHQTHHRRAQGPRRAGFKGVHLCQQTRKWRARIEIAGVKYCLGRHATETDAAVAYDSAVLVYFGPDGFTNLLPRS